MNQAEYTKAYGLTSAALLALPPGERAEVEATFQAVNALAAEVVAQHGCTDKQARAGIAYLAHRQWGATVQGGGYHTFAVPDGWDGCSYFGYFRPTIEQVARDTGRSFWLP